MWRLDLDDGSCRVSSHTGRPAQVLSSWLDEAGRLYLHCDLGFGLVHSLDTGLAADAIEAGQWQPAELRAAEMPARFGYVLEPRPA